MVYILPIFIIFGFLSTAISFNVFKSYFIEFFYFCYFVLGNIFNDLFILFVEGETNGYYFLIDYFYFKISFYDYFFVIYGDCFGGFDGCEFILYFLDIFIEFVGFCSGFDYLIYLVFYFCFYSV